MDSKQSIIFPMDLAKSENFKRIETAIRYIRENFQWQPDLDQVAEQVNLSPFHFQKLFTEWAGVSPKKFLQYTTITYAKERLKTRNVTLFGAAMDVGLSGTGRLHDLFIQIEGMTPGEYKNGGEQLEIQYSFSESPFGNVLCASTKKGICHLSFVEEETIALSSLMDTFPNAKYRQAMDPLQESALQIFYQKWNQLDQIKLHLKGTHFQLKVWEALLKIPSGGLTSYGNIAEQLSLPKAARAVGSAVGDNPVAYLIPCHRVIQSGGTFGQYHWGETRKIAMIGWEASQLALSR